MDQIRSRTIDAAKLDLIVSRAIGDLSAGYGGVMVSIGHRLGLYKAMAEAGPVSSHQLAARTGCAERYIREWLGSQVAGGYVIYDVAGHSYELPAENAMVLAQDDSPVFMAAAWAIPASMWADEDKALEAFRTGAGIPGATMTDGSIAVSPRFTAMPTRQASSPNGCRRSMAWSKS